MCLRRCSQVTFGPESRDSGSRRLPILEARDRAGVQEAFTPVFCLRAGMAVSPALRRRPEPHRLLTDSRPWEPRSPQCPELIPHNRSVYMASSWRTPTNALIPTRALADLTFLHPDFFSSFFCFQQSLLWASVPHSHLRSGDSCQLRVTERETEAQPGG